MNAATEVEKYTKALENQAKIIVKYRKALEEIVSEVDKIENPSLLQAPTFGLFIPNVKTIVKQALRGDEND